MYSCGGSKKNFLVVDTGKQVPDLSDKTQQSKKNRKFSGREEAWGEKLREKGGLFGQ